MRRSAGLAIVLAFGAAHGAAAGAPVSPAASALTAAAFAAPPAPDGSIAALLNRSSLAADVGPDRWRIGEVRIAHEDGPVDTVRFSLGEPVGAPGAPPLRLLHPGADEPYEVTVVRNWPGAMSFNTGGFGLDVSPHAGVGVSSYGGLAEAGAKVELGRSRDNAAVQRLKALGVRDGSSFGGQGRWYLFAAASGRAVGLNMLRGEQGWNRAGWTTDPTSTLVGDAQVGVGWRKGAMQTSLGFVHREIKAAHGLYGVDSKADSLVAFSFSVRPRR